MTGDPIIDEIRRYRDEYAARFGYDVNAIGADMRRRFAEREAIRRAELEAGRSTAAAPLPAEDYAGVIGDPDST